MKPVNPLLPVYPIIPCEPVNPLGPLPLPPVSTNNVSVKLPLTVVGFPSVIKIVNVAGSNVSVTTPFKNPVAVSKVKPAGKVSGSILYDNGVDPPVVRIG